MKPQCQLADNKSLRCGKLPDDRRASLFPADNLPEDAL
jgi:hypothetical protein